MPIIQQYTSPQKHARRQRPYYDSRIDFQRLAHQDEAWSRAYSSTAPVDWQDADVVQTLTKAILRLHFGLSLSLPDDRLCPPVPVRWNYVRWLQDLLDTTKDEDEDHASANDEVTGLDIGVGASCIYSLLMCATRPDWQMLGTDIDEHSLEYAAQNVSANGMDQRIKLRQTTVDSPLLPLDAANLEAIDFVMCNPPFYSSKEDMDNALELKESPPSAVCTGSENEMICEDGDIGFATRIFEESLVLRHRVRWYSCMLGRLSSAQQLVAKFKEHGIDNFAAANIRAGQKTARWALAWSFHDMRPTTEVSRHGELVAALLPAATERTIAVLESSAPALSLQVNVKMNELDVKWTWHSESSTGLAITAGNVWSRSARRKKRFKHDAIHADEMTDDQVGREAAKFAALIKCSNNELLVRWLKGHDATIFESFCGMLKTSLGLRNSMTGAAT